MDWATAAATLFSAALGAIGTYLIQKSQQKYNKVEYSLQRNRDMKETVYKKLITALTSRKYNEILYFLTNKAIPSHPRLPNEEMVFTEEECNELELLSAKLTQDLYPITAELQLCGSHEMLRLWDRLFSKILLLGNINYIFVHSSQDSLIALFDLDQNLDEPKDKVMGVVKGLNEIIKEIINMARVELEVVSS